MRTNKFLWALPCLTLLFAATLSSCSEKDDDQPVTKHHFLMSAQADNGFFITSFENFNEGTSVSYDKAITLDTSLWRNTERMFIFSQAQCMVLVVSRPFTNTK